MSPPGSPCRDRPRCREHPLPDLLVGLHAVLVLDVAKGASVQDEEAEVAAFRQLAVEVGQPFVVGGNGLGHGPSTGQVHDSPARKGGPHSRGEVRRVRPEPANVGHPDFCWPRCRRALPKGRRIGARILAEVGLCRSWDGYSATAGSSAKDSFRKPSSTRCCTGGVSARASTSSASSPRSGCRRRLPAPTAFPAADPRGFQPDAATLVPKKLVTRFKVIPVAPAGQDALPRDGEPVRSHRGRPASATRSATSSARSWSPSSAWCRCSTTTSGSTSVGDTPTPAAPKRLRCPLG